MFSVKMQAALAGIFQGMCVQLSGRISRNISSVEWNIRFINEKIHFFLHVRVLSATRDHGSFKGTRTVFPALFLKRR